MGKFRSKLKRHNKGKSWGRGQSATSNPQNTKHRSKATSRFFQANLNEPTNQSNTNALTSISLAKHDAKLLYGNDQMAGAAPTINDIACSLKSFKFDGDDDMISQGYSASIKTYQTFASNYTACTNMSFKKLLNGFRNDSQHHKEMLAILAALTDVIKQRGGTESSTEYFLALMETLEAGTEDGEIAAALSLLNMGIRTVPEAVLRRKFSECTSVLLALIKRFINGDYQNILKNIFGPLAILLRAQEYSVWKLSSTLEIFETMLAFTIHSKPKIRKAAQHHISSIIHGSHFMAPQRNPNEDNGDIDRDPLKTMKLSCHPASGCVAQFSIKQFKPENIASAQTLVLHTMVMLRETISRFKTDDIKATCECLISIMTAANVLIRTNCFQVMHSLFSSKTPNLNAVLTGKLITAIYEFRPDKLDVRQTLAWLTVLKEGHICLASYDITMCIHSLPRLIDICARDLWISDRTEIIASSSNTIKELMIECIKPGCETKQLADIHRQHVTKVVNAIGTALMAPFGHTAVQVLLTFATVFESIGRFYTVELSQALTTIGSRYDVDSSLRLQIEHAILAAISSMGPEMVLKSISLVDAAGDVSLKQSWLLPLLREGIKESSLEYFTKHILQLASNCHAKWHQLKAANNIPLAHTYELLYCQLWGLFPGFCRKPIDMFNFRALAKTVGTVLKHNPEIRASILDGLKELMTNADDDGKNELARFSKNFLPILFNIYSTKPSGSYENDLRDATLAVIQEYLKITPKALLTEMFTMAMEQYSTLAAASFEAESVFNIIEQLAVHQSSDDLAKLFEHLIEPHLAEQPKQSNSNEKTKWLRRKGYQLLENILYSTSDECCMFIDENTVKMHNLILNGNKIACKITQKSRLNCIKFLIDKEVFQVDGDHIKRIIVEILPLYSAFSRKTDNIAADLIIAIGHKYEANNALNEFINMLMANFKTDIEINSNLIIVLKSVIGQFAGGISVPQIENCLEKVLRFLVGKNRNEAESSVAFLISFLKYIPTPLVLNHLPIIMKSLSCMVPDTKRYCRIHIGYVLRKLCKRFGAEHIKKLVPGNDEITHKKLKNIRKQLSREKRSAITKQSAKDCDSSDDELTGDLIKKSYNIDDILDESESEIDDEMDDAAAEKHKKGTKNQTYIQEDPEGIVDLADIQSIRHIRTTKPQIHEQANTTDTNSTSRKQNANRGFKLAEDGRLIIAEPKRHQQMSDDDSDDGNDNGETNPSNQKKRTLASDSDSDNGHNDTTTIKTKKRKVTDTASLASGKTGDSKYVAGGKGIHRAHGAQSVKSAISTASMATTKAASTVYHGSEYKSKKAQGDIKKKGKMDPYAYIPLSRNSLNKRKRLKNAGQFKNIVKGARKGSAAGAKNKVKKSM